MYKLLYCSFKFSLIGAKLVLRVAKASSVLIQNSTDTTKKMIVRTETAIQTAITDYFIVNQTVIDLDYLDFNLT